MNIENMTKLRDLLVTLTDEQFEMSRWTNNRVEKDGYTIRLPPDVHTCGTAGCIAGWAASLAALEGVKIEYSHFVEPIVGAATKWLDLTCQEANILFEGYWSLLPVSSITREAAIRHLGCLIVDELEATQ